MIVRKFVSFVCAIIFIITGNLTSICNYSTFAYESASLSDAIIIQPQDYTGMSGNQAVFSICVEGTNTSYQWQWRYNNSLTWNNISKLGNENNYKVSINEKTASRVYRCCVYDAFSNETVYSNEVKIIMDNCSNIKIINQPNSIYGVENEKATFSISAEGSDISYQWQWRYKNSTIWNSISSNANENSYTVAINSITSNRIYRCMVTQSDLNGFISSNEVTITMVKNPVVSIVEQPTSFYGEIGDKALLKIETIGEPLEYQWQWRSKNGYYWNDISKLADSSSYIVPVTKTSTSRVYRCKVRNMITDETIISDEVNIIHVNNIKNDLITDGLDEQSFISVYKNGIESNGNYGKQNVRYQIDLNEMNTDKMHVFFEYRFNENICYQTTTSANEMIPIFSVGSVKAGIWRKSPTSNNGLVATRSYVGSCVGGSSESHLLNAANYNVFQGDDAFFVKYLGNMDDLNNHDVIMILDPSAVIFKHRSGSEILNIPVSCDTSIAALVEKINLSDLFESSFNGNGERLYSELPINSLYSIPLVYEYKYYNNSMYWDNPPIYIPYKYDEKWHTFEAIIDNSQKIAYIAFDGYTIKKTIPLSPLNNKIMSIGEVYGNSETPLQIKNLEINCGNFGDAEIIESVTPYYVDDEDNIPDNRTKVQLISQHNPRLLIFEGHGIINCSDQNAPGQGEYTSEDAMATSTERLEKLFDLLSKKGYEPITWEQLINWKKNDMPIPKRSYCLMFDDFRIMNYLDSQKRKPFEEYNVKPGLALISEGTGSIVPIGYDMDKTTISVEGSIYTIRQCFDKIRNAGWYLCSHTNNHRFLSSVKVSETDHLLELDVLSANLHEISSKVLVYPGGNYDNRFTSLMKNSDFEVGVDIVRNWYNCKACSDYRLVRVELATRQTWNKLIMPIV